MNNMRNVLVFSWVLMCAFNLKAQKKIEVYKVGKQTSKLFYSKGVVLVLEKEFQYKCMGRNKELKDESFSYENIASVEHKKIPLLFYSSLVIVQMDNGDFKRFKVLHPKAFVTDIKARITN